MKRAALGMLLWWIMAMGIQADPLVFTPTHLSIHVGGELLTFHPVPLAVRVAKDPYLSLTDPTMVLLLQRLKATVEVTSDLGTVTAHLGGLQSTLDVNSGRGTAGSQAIFDPTATVVRNGEVVMSLSGLVEMLGLTLVPLDAAGGEYQLVSTLSGLAVVRTPQGRVLQLDGAGPMVWRSIPNSDGTLALLLENTACKLPDQSVLGGVTVRVVNRGGAAAPTRLELAWDPYWSGQAGQDGVLLSPRYPGVGPGPDGRLTGLAQQGSDWLLQGVPDTSQTTALYAWRLVGTDLMVDLVHCLPGDALQAPAAVRVEALTDKPYGVTRLTWHVDADTGFSFAVGPPLTVHLGPRAGFPSLRMAGFESGGSTVSGTTIVIDPGHGGSDPGAISPLSGLREKDVTLDVALKLQQELQAKGWRVLMTRTDDRDLTYAGSPNTLELGARVAVADAPGVALFLSIHCNASLNQGARGTSIHWNKAIDLPLAQVLCEDLGAALGIPMNGTVQSPFYVLRHTQVPSVLIETAYITNPEEGGLLAQQSFRTLLATTIAASLNRYLRQQAGATTH